MKRIKGVLLAALLTVTVSMPVYADRSEKVELPQSSTDYYMTVDSGEDGVDIYPSTDKKSGKFNGTEIKDGTVNIDFSDDKIRDISYKFTINSDELTLERKEKKDIVIHKFKKQTNNRYE